MKVNIDYSKSYDKKRKGKKSRWLPILIMDWLFQREKGKLYTTYFYCFGAFTLTANLFLYFALEKYGVDTSWYFWTIFFYLSPIDIVYRHYRHKYFKTHDLPGPYGWGTLDKDYSGTYFMTND